MKKLVVDNGLVHDLVFFPSADKLNSVFTLLDAFGNSRTIMNTSATKFSSLFSLDFDHAGQIATANIQVSFFVSVTKLGVHQICFGVDSVAFPMLF